jgi:hypothetical protein
MSFRETIELTKWTTAKPPDYNYQVPIMLEILNNSTAEILDYKIEHDTYEPNKVVNFTVGPLQKGSIVSIHFYYWVLIENNNYSDLPQYVKIPKKCELPEETKPWLSSTDVVQANVQADEYEKFGRQHDLKLLGTASGMWLNILHLHGENIYFDKFTDYPVQVINWHDRETSPSLSDAKNIFNGVVCGGLRRIQTMELGTPEQVQAEARDAILSTGNQRFILGTGCVLPITTPRINILAAIKSSLQ